MVECVEIENCQLWCGDAAAVMATLPQESIDLCVTSPPYDQLRTYGGHVWDFPQTAAALTALLRPGGVIVWVVQDQYINGSKTGTSFRQALHFKEVCGLSLHDTMIYRKTNPGGARGSSRGYWQCFEYMFVFSQGPPRTFHPITDRKNHKTTPVYLGGGHRNTDGTLAASHAIHPQNYGRRLNCWDISNSNHESEHPGAFPLSLARDHIQSWSNEGDTVLDCFLGSGTTGIAARELGRRFVGIEIDGTYFGTACQRIDAAHRQGRLFTPAAAPPVQQALTLDAVV